MSQKGHTHPLSSAIRHIHSIFADMGFEIADGKEIIPESQNFDILNFPPDHPARDTHDTFWIKGPKESTVARTHISSLQVPYMLEHKPPLRMVSSGLVYRAEATDATHEAQFHYTEGLVVGKNITLAHLKGTLERFLSEFFEASIPIRFRPGNFPFVEPGVEVEMRYTAQNGETRWLEMLGAGMVHPQVLKNGGIDPQKYQGFAFGVGVNRLLLIKYGIPDVRLFYQGDLRFTNQF